MKPGDLVFVTVMGEPRPAVVLVPVTALGNVEVELVEPFDLPGLTVPVRQLVRAPGDVRPREGVTVADDGRVSGYLHVHTDECGCGLVLGPPEQMSARIPADGPFDSLPMAIALALALLAFFLLTLWLLT